MRTSRIGFTSRSAIRIACSMTSRASASAAETENANGAARRGHPDQPNLDTPDGGLVD
jgi:hypothetical protein